MKKTREKILTSAIQLFNKTGVSSARLQDIAKKAGISAGNLSYHYKLKKDLVEGVLDYMEQSFLEMSKQNMIYINNNNQYAVIKSYLSFQIGHRFFYRDILEISKLFPEAQKVYENQMQQVMNFSKNGLYLAVGRGILQPEPHAGHYDIFVKNAWAILNSYLIEREVLGEEKVSMHQIILAVWEFHFPYFTEKGKQLFLDWKKQLPKLIEEEMMV